MNRKKRMVQTLRGFALLGLLGLTACAVQIPRDALVRTQLPAEARWSASVWGAAVPGGASGDESASGEAGVLSADGAVRLAFGENPQARLLRAEFLAEMAAVDVAAAGGGVGLSWSRLRPEAGMAQLAWALSVPLEAWLTLPARRRQAYWDGVAAAQRAGWQTLQLEHEIRMAWATAVGRQQRSAQLATAAEVAGLAAELAARYHGAGNLSRGELHAHELRAGEALAEAAEASVSAAEARAALATLLGLPSTDSRLRLPSRLPAVATKYSGDEPVPQFVAEALRQRLDLRAARSAVTAQVLESARRKRWSKWPALHVGAEREREPDGERRRGPAIDAEWSPERLAEAGLANAAVNAAQARAELLAVQVVNEVTLRAQAYRRALDLANLRSARLLPLQEAKLGETLRKHQYMLEGPFELLAERREVAEMAAQTAEQELSVWLALQQLQSALGGTP
jgi:outer membrane protein, heavy metal efflux system